jgi:hypothetical protein
MKSIFPAIDVKKHLGRKKQSRLPNAYRYKLERLAAYQPRKNAPLGKIGIPNGIKYV